MILVAAAAVRICGARGDLWLDEIGSLQMAGRISSPLGVFTQLHHDNNHYLNTLFLYYVGPHGNSLAYRSLSILAGVGTVAMAWLIGRRRSAVAGLLTMLLTAFSYVMVLYSSEARGYSAAVFFSFLSFYLLERYFETKRWWLAAAFSLSAAMGFLSHLTFLSFYLAALVWSGYRLMKSRLGFRQTVIAAISCHAIPIALLATLYFVDIRHLAFAGGSSSTPLIGYGSALAWALGTPSAEFAILLTCIAAVVILDVGLRMLWRERADLVVLFVGAIVVFPVVLTVGSVSGVIYVRYFMIAIAFFLILLGFVMAELCRRGPWGKAACAALLLAFLTANGYHIASLFQYGRGHYCDAIRFLAEHSHGSPVTFGGDHDLRIPFVLQFYWPTVAGDRKAEYYKQGSWPPQGPEWVIFHKESAEAPTPPATELKYPAGNEYELVRTFPSAPLSGLHWFLYHNRSM
jgi:hypothetical protein